MDGGPKDPASAPTGRQRALAAVAYLGPLFLLTALQSHGHRFLRFHARQGFGLFLLEALLLAIWIILSRTLGRIPFLGIVVMVTTDALALALVIFLAAVGMVRALAGDRVRLPLLGPWVDRVLPHERSES